MGPNRWLAIACLVVVGACGTAGPLSSGDGGVADADSGAASCGAPGDRGNAVGVGKYCTVLADCSNNLQASICATSGEPTQRYCTSFCYPPDAGGANPCGVGASCRCDRMLGLCSCVPDACQ